MTISIGFAEDLGVSRLSIREFYENNWTRKVALSDEKFYKWQFVDPPCNEGRDSCVVAFDAIDKVIHGVMGLNKRSFYCRNELSGGAELTTWVVSAAKQGSGVGLKILNFIQDNFDFLIGMGVSQMALPIYMKSGFRFLRSIPRFVKVINLDGISDYSNTNRLSIKLTKMWGNDVVNDFSATALDWSERVNPDEGLRLYASHFLRDAKQLQWRYSNHPYFRYKSYSIRNNAENASAEAYVVIREELSLSEFKILHVMDLFGSEECLPQAVRFVEDYAKNNNFDVIDFYCTSSFVYKFILASGWFSINDDECFSFPNLFHPIELREPPTTSLIYWAKNDMTEMCDLSRLYITKQDADLDRPTTHTIVNLKESS